jgi:WhiB family transcriptional regulator, redox-sensing transcriptional regulator
VGEQPWERRAACAPQNRPTAAKDLDWHSTDTEEKYAARAVCMNKCPVRSECLQFALDSKFIHGIWGGVDDYELRRTMSVDALGAPAERDRAPRCPYCCKRSLVISGSKTKDGYKTVCNRCDLIWHMAVIPNKLKKKKRDAA